MKGKIDFSYSTVVKFFILLLGAWFIYRIRQLLLILFVSFIIMSALKPVVRILEKTRLHRAWSIVVVYVFIWLFIGGILASIIPPLVTQTGNLIMILPSSLSKIQLLNLDQSAVSGQIISLLGSLPENVLNIAGNIFGNIINLITTLVISFYLLTERDNLDKYLGRWLGERRALEVSALVSRIEARLGTWVRGELILMLTIGVLCYLGLRILGVETALPLALLAGLFEIIPSIGPILSAIPAVIFAFTINPLVALSTVALYFLVHNLENSFVVPIVMNKATGVNPLISLLGLLIGFELAGAVGTVLAIPAILVIETVGAHYLPPAQQKE